MKVVITGATSFIGVHVINECVKKDYEVYAVVRPNSINLSHLPENDKIHVIELEMGDYDKLAEHIDYADAFVHLAWEGAREPQRDNEEMQLKNYECAISAMNAANHLGCQVFLGSGSQAEYGKVDGEVTELSPCNPTTEYGKKKLLTCSKLNEIANSSGIRFVWTRIFSVYGKYDYAGTLIMSAGKKMKNDEPIELTACTQLWDYLYVEDAAKAIVTLVEKEKASGIYNIASGVKKPLRAFVEEMKDVFKSKSELKFGMIQYGAGGPVNLRPSNAKLMSLGWRPEVDFKEGITEMLHNVKF